MIAYLPKIYPDELVYSWFCRFYIHSGCITNKMALQEILFARSNNPSKEFLGHLNPEMERAIRGICSFKDLVLNHTMFPQYARFIPISQKQNALYRIEHEFCDMHHLFAILPRSRDDSYLKYCPLCVQEDRENYGEAYWHRKHQIRNMNICTKHKCYLANSAVTAKSEQTFTLCPAELFVESREPHYVENPLQIAFSEYLTNIFDFPIDFQEDISISAVLYHAMSQTKYMKQSGKSRYTKQFAEDLKGYYKDFGLTDVASMSRIQRVLLADGFDFSVVCQIAFFLGMRAKELAAPMLTDEQLRQERESHYTRDKAPVDWTAYDEETAPILAQLAQAIYTGTASDISRPERVSEKMIYRELDLPKYRLENLPKCNALMKQFSETYEECWARRLIWAYEKLKAEKNGAPFFWSDLRSISGVKKKNIDKIIPYLKKHTDKSTEKAIIQMVSAEKIH